MKKWETVKRPQTETSSHCKRSVENKSSDLPLILKRHPVHLQGAASTSIA